MNNKKLYRQTICVNGKKKIIYGKYNETISIPGQTTINLSKIPLEKLKAMQPKGCKWEPTGKSVSWTEDFKIKPEDLINE